MSSVRFLFLDVARAAAAIFMVFIHVQGTLSLPDVSQSVYGFIISVLGEAPAAPVFMFAMGVSYTLSTNASFLAKTKRGVNILLKGYQLNLLRLFIPLLLVLPLASVGLLVPEVGKEEHFLSELLQNLLVVDILQFAGLAYLFLTLLSCLKLNNPKILITLILLTISVSPLLWGIDTGNAFFDRVLDLLWGDSGEYVSFPFFPWIAFPLLGVLCGELYVKSSHVSQTLKKQMLVGTLVLLCGVGITLTNRSFHMGDYWRTGPGGMLIYLGFIPIWIYACEKCLRWLKGWWFDTTLFISKNITLFYVIQWIIISCLIALLGQNKTNMAVTIVLQMAVTIISLLLTQWRVTHKTKKRMGVVPMLCLLCVVQIACSTDNDYRSTKLAEMRMKEIRHINQDKKLSEIEKEEGVATVNSIFSFANEIAHGKDNYYAPYVLEWILPDRKFAGDNPDAQYFSFFIDPQASYELEVMHDSVFFMEITSYRRIKKQNMISNSFVVPSSKSKVIISAKKGLSPDLHLSETDYIVMVRYYKTDAKTLLPKPIVRCTQIPKKKKGIKQKMRYDLAVTLFEALYRSSVLLTAQMEQQVNSYIDDLEMNNPYVKNLYPAKSNIYNGVFIHIPEGKYLSVKGKIDKSKYAVFVFYNRWWATPFTGGNKVSINTKSLETDADGQYEIVIVREDRNLPNSIVIKGLERGILSIRSIFEEVEEPTLELKSF